MNIYNTIVIFILIYYTRYIISCFSRKNRVRYKKINRRLDNLRRKKVKSLADRKRFLDLKFPIGGSRWSWRGVPKILITLIIYVVMFRLYYYVFNIYNVSFSFGWFIMFFVLFPIFMNLILGRFNLQKDDLLKYFKN